MEDHKKELQKIVDLYCEATARLLKYLTKREKEIIKSYKGVAALLKEKGLFDDILAYVKEEADKGDHIYLKVYNLLKYGPFPESGNKIHSAIA